MLSSAPTTTSISVEYMDGGDNPAEQTLFPDAETSGQEFSCV